MANDNGLVHPTPVTAWQLIGGVISIVAVMVVAMWTVVTYLTANEKAITDDYRTNYTTNREHNDLVARLNREVRRIEDDHKRLNDTMMSRAEFKAWADERTKVIDRLVEEAVKRQEFVQVLKGFDTLQSRLMLLEQTRPTTGELQATTAALRDRIEKLYLMLQSQEDYLRTTRQVPSPSSMPK